VIGNRRKDKQYEYDFSEFNKTLTEREVMELYGGYDG